MSNRRDFLKHTAGTRAAAGLLPPTVTPDSSYATDGPPEPAHLRLPPSDQCLDLTPARWIWYPSTRTLPNSVVLFRRTISLTAPVRSAQGWIAADSRYLLTLNGKRLQWGPAPADPRRMEVDPLDLTPHLRQGDNVIGVTVLHYGHGDGTHPIGKPGLIVTLSIQCEDGSALTIVSDTGWLCHLARSWRPGQYKRWYIRSFQEDFDARRHPYGWEEPSFVPDESWIAAMPLPCAASLPPICSGYPDYLMDVTAKSENCCLLPRSVPLVAESRIPVTHLREAFSILWKRPPEEYFEVVPKNAYEHSPLPDVHPGVADSWHLRLDTKRGVALTFELPEQIVGFPEFTIEAPEGTIVELLVHEAHRPGGPVLLNTHFHAWARFVCRGGVNHFRCFEYESLRWIQLHIHGTAGRVTISDIAVLRRMFPWAHTPHIAVSDLPLQRLLNASINTLYNSAQETFVDGMGRERQQYSGDAAHQMHGAYLAFGEHRMPARFISTYSQGLMTDGYFFDCWPAYDRLARVMERQLDLTPWGPLLDHAIGFGFDCHHHYLYTGNLAQVADAVIRLQRFVAYLHRSIGPDGLLPVMDIGLPAVWIDHEAYAQQKHKQCAFNLYAAAMLCHAFAPLAEALGHAEWAGFARTMASRIAGAVQRSFWSPQERLFINNLPWRREEGETRMCDRSLATAVLFGFCPNNDTAPSLSALAACPSGLGISYPANACWRYWALAEGGRTDVILQDFRNRWATMDSVRLNNTIAEYWTAQPDALDLWSHCAIVPLYMMFMSIAGIKPTAPGFSRCSITPQPADLDRLELTAHTIRGDISFCSLGRTGEREVRLRIPEGMEAELRVDRREDVALGGGLATHNPQLVGYVLPAGKDIVLKLKYT